MHQPPRPEWLSLSPHENISGTSSQETSAESDASGGCCAFVTVNNWRYGDGDPFCGAPAVAGSAYCAVHRALCQIPPGTRAGIAAARALRREAEIAAPPALGLLDAPALPEVESAAEAAALVDLRRLDEGGEE